MDVFNDFVSRVEDPARRQRLMEVLSFVEKTFPHLEKRIAWGQPMFTDHGTFIAAFSLAKAHLAFSPEAHALTRFSERIKQAGFDHTSMLLRFPWNRPIDYDLLRDLIAFNIKDKQHTTTFWRKPGQP